MYKQVGEVRWNKRKDSLLVSFMGTDLSAAIDKIKMDGYGTPNIDQTRVIVDPMNVKMI